METIINFIWKMNMAYFKNAVHYIFGRFTIDCYLKFSLKENLTVSCNCFTRTYVFCDFFLQNYVIESGGNNSHIWHYHWQFLLISDFRWAHLKSQGPPSLYLTRNFQQHLKPVWTLTDLLTVYQKKIMSHHDVYIRQSRRMLLLSIINIPVAAV